MGNQAAGPLPRTVRREQPEFDGLEARQATITVDDLGRAALRDAEQRAGAIRVGFFQMVAAAVLGGRAGKEHPPDAMAAKRGHQIGRALNVDVDVLLGGRRWIERVLAM